jgi:hypothetical protein
MAELLCGAIPRICRTVAARHRRINDGFGVSAPELRRKKIWLWALIDPD